MENMKRTMKKRTMNKIKISTRTMDKRIMESENEGKSGTSGNTWKSMEQVEYVEMTECHLTTVRWNIDKGRY